MLKISPLSLVDSNVVHVKSAMKTHKQCLLITFKSSDIFTIGILWVNIILYSEYLQKSRYFLLTHLFPWTSNSSERETECKKTKKDEVSKKENHFPYLTWAQTEKNPTGSEYWEIRTRVTPNMDTFHAVALWKMSDRVLNNINKVDKVLWEITQIIKIADESLDLVSVSWILILKEMIDK